MSIWFQEVSIDRLNEFSKNTMLEHLGIEFTEIGADYLKARMPVDHRTVQAAGLLHGGASVALAESLGSVAATLCVDATRKICVGLEINANHLRSVRSGYVEGIAKPLQIGRRIQVWEIKISNEKNKLVAVSRITLAVVSRNEI